MEISRMAQTGPDINYTVRVGGEELAAMAQGIMIQMLDLVAKQLAEDYLKDHGNAIIASINPKIVVNKAIAEVVCRIAKNQ